MWDANGKWRFRFLIESNVAAIHRAACHGFRIPSESHRSEAVAAIKAIAEQLHLSGATFLLHITESYFTNVLVVSRHFLGPMDGPGISIGNWYLGIGPTRYDCVMVPNPKNPQQKKSFCWPICANHHKKRRMTAVMSASWVWTIIRRLIYVGLGKMVGRTTFERRMWLTCGLVDTRPVTTSLLLKQFQSFRPPFQNLSRSSWPWAPSLRFWPCSRSRSESSWKKVNFSMCQYK